MCKITICTVSERNSTLYTFAFLIVAVLVLHTQALKVKLTAKMLSDLAFVGFWVIQTEREQAAI